MIKIAIFGVGLIGGSLALCFKDQPGLYVVGHSIRPASIERYRSRNVVDHATTSMREAAEDADFIFLCGPVGILESYLQQLTELPLKPGCIITDVGSTKRSICQFAESLALKDVYFIGGHPMAGSERSGVEAASPQLFVNAFYILTPSKSVPEPQVQRLSNLLQHTKAQIIRVDSAIHDDIVGAISHLPHIIAVALVNQIAEYNESNELYRSLAAGGFRDTTRIASSDPVMWRDILIDNREVMLQLLADWNGKIAQFVELLQNSDGAGIEREFSKANQYRNQMKR